MRNQPTDKGGGCHVSATVHRYVLLGSYLERPVAEAVEQGDGDDAAQRAVQRRQETRAGCGERERGEREREKIKQQQRDDSDRNQARKSAAIRPPCVAVCRE